MAKMFWVDVPDPHLDGDWINVGICDSKEEALEFIREHIDFTCDDEGRVCLISEGEDEEDEATS